MVSFQNWVQLSVLILSIIPLYFLIRSYYRTRMLDYLLFSGVFISASIALLFDFIRSTYSNHINYAQLIDSTHLLIYFFLFIHASRIKWSSIHKKGLILVILQMVILQISILLYEFHEELTNQSFVLFTNMMADRFNEGGSYAFVISGNNVIMGENFRFLLFVFRLPIQIFFLYVYLSVTPARETNRIVVGKKIMSTAILILIFNTCIQLGHSMDFWSQPLMLLDIFNLITFILIGIVFIQYPETILLTHVQVKRAVQVVPATTGLLEYKVLLHPVRLTIIKILYDNNSMLSSDLRKMLEISWGKFSQHVKNLENNGFIISKREFIDNSPQNRLYIEERGRTHFFELQDILLKIFSGR